MALREPSASSFVTTATPTRFGRGHASQSEGYLGKISSVSSRRCRIVGSVEQYPNKASAPKALAAFRADINAENPLHQFDPDQFLKRSSNITGKRNGARIAAKHGRRRSPMRAAFQQVDSSLVGLSAEIDTAVKPRDMTIFKLCLAFSCRDG